MRSLFFCLFLTTYFIGFCQNIYNPNTPPNTYRQADNPNYWKNKAPLGYWQQDVHYTIKANIDETKDIIDANQTLVYWNNSPDELNVLYFHLYQNAFIPDSYCSELHRQNNKAIGYGRYEKKGLGTVVENMRIDGKQVNTILDNTILKVELNEPLPSGDSITIQMDFKTYFDQGTQRRRMKTFKAFGHNHYDGVLWYPRISVYDKKFGWTTDQHIGKEFYGDFGTFDVELTFSSNYVVEATGMLQNKDEVMPETLRQKLDIKNFADKPWNSAPSIIIPYDSLSRKTWIYHAENVHDFAFTADPTYRIGEAEWNGIRAISLVQEPHASKWQNAADFAAKVIQVFSEDIGMYEYNKIIVADARDGMEYPMITLDGGSDPGYRGLLAHEIGHQWFYAMVGSNETYRAALDEGFTQFLTAWALNKIDGEYLVTKEPSSKYTKRHKKKVKAIDSRVYYSYIRDATKYNDPPLNTHSHEFNSALGHGGGYRHVYYKTAAMLYNLEYVLGEELFLDAMKYYFEKWKMAHPYFDDFRQSIIEHTKVDLNWFFDQWLETSKTIDYGIKKINHLGNENYRITFERKGEMHMPIDFSVFANDGKEYKFHISNTWFTKKTNATILKKWHAWGKLFPQYSTELNIPSGIDYVQIDPSNRLADKYMLDNKSQTPIDVSFDSRIWNLPDWKTYELNNRPELWWNDFDGMKVGWHFNGDYMNYHHQINSTIWVNTGLLQKKLDNTIANEYNAFSYRFNYKTGLDKWSKNTSITLHSRFLDGLNLNKLHVEKSDYSKKNKVYAYFKSMYRQSSYDLLYTNYNHWQNDKFNNTASFGWQHKYTYVNGKGVLNLELKSSAIGSDYDYSSIVFSSVHKSKIGQFYFNSRAFAQYGSGTNWANESRLHLAGANSEEMMENKFSRSSGFIPTEWLGYGESTNHFQMGGGLNLRGFAGYLVPEINEDGQYVEAYRGESGASVSFELEFQNLLPVYSNNFSTYLFADAGVINTTEINSKNIRNAFSDVRADAGIGFALTLKKWGDLQMVKPLTIRLDFPMYLNTIPNVDDDNFQTNRFVMGIGRTF